MGDLWGINQIFPIFSDFADFWDFLTDFFFDDLLNIRLVSPLKPLIPHGSPIVVFYKK